MCTISFFFKSFESTSDIKYAYFPLWIKFILDVSILKKKKSVEIYVTLQLYLKRKNNHFASIDLFATQSKKPLKLFTVY